MEYDQKVCKFIIKTLNQGEIQDKILKVQLKQKFNIGGKERIKIMSMLMQTGTVEAKQKGESIVYNISKKLNLKKRNNSKDQPKRKLK